MDDKGIIALFWLRDEQAIKETLAVYGNAMYSLFREARGVLLSRCFEGKSIQEIAGEFRLSEGNVRTILWRTRKLLKKHLESEGIQV